MNLKTLPTQSSDSCHFVFKVPPLGESSWKPTILQARESLFFVISASGCYATFMQILVSINDNLTHKKGHSLTLDLVQSSFLALCTVRSGRVATDNRQRDCRTPGMDPSSYS